MIDLNGTDNLLWGSCSGCFSPVHVNHLLMIAGARAHVEEEWLNAHVAGAYMSPVSPQRILRKVTSCTSTAATPADRLSLYLAGAQVRVDLIRKALQQPCVVDTEENVARHLADCSWIAVDAHQATHQVAAAATTERLREIVHQTFESSKPAGTT